MVASGFAQVNKFISVSRRRSLLKSSSVSLIQSGQAAATEAVENLQSRLALDWSPFGARVSAVVATPQYQLMLGLLGFILAVLIAYGQPINAGGLVVFVILYIAVLLGMIAMIESSFMFGAVFKSFDTLYLMGNCTGVCVRARTYICVCARSYVCVCVCTYVSACWVMHGHLNLHAHT